MDVICTIKPGDAGANRSLHLTYDHWEAIHPKHDVVPAMLTTNLELRFGSYP
jgi:hypothetical protein